MKWNTWNDLYFKYTKKMKYSYNEEQVKERNRIKSKTVYGLVCKFGCIGVCAFHHTAAIHAFFVPWLSPITWKMRKTIRRKAVRELNWTELIEELRLIKLCSCFFALFVEPRPIWVLMSTKYLAGFPLPQGRLVYSSRAQDKATQKSKS